VRRPRTAQRAVPALWLNLVCLDAPLVAIAWLWLFARTFRIPVQVGNGVALFLTAWLIYLGDRLADSASLEPGGPQSLRQQFCRRHRKLWIIMIALVAGFDAYIIWRITVWETLLAGAVVGGLALIYLVLNHPLGLIWRSLPAKEPVIGLLFAAGTLVALLPALKSVTASLAVPAIFFAALCALNCISIASWERELDQAQGKISVATRHPGFTRLTALICGVLAGTSLAVAIIQGVAAPLLACISMSALLLAWLNATADPQGAAVYKPPWAIWKLPFFDVDRDQRTALADLVLLTPIVVALIASSL
jgi:hypothetical protein